MDIHGITLPLDDAREQLESYRAELRRRADAEYEAVVTGLEAMVAGLPVIDLAEVFRRAPRDAEGRPHLAVARADRQRVQLEVRRWASTVLRFGSQAPGVGGWSRPQLTIAHPQLTIAVSGQDPAEGRSGYAIVPMVPASVRQSLRDRRLTVDLRKYVTLWEVEAWADAPIRSRPDRDPYLLSLLGGNAYAVVAEWDLTDLERMVMAGRAQ